MAIDSRIVASAGLVSVAQGVPASLAAGRDSSLLVSHGYPDYFEMSRRGLLQQAHAIVTAPVIYTTAAGTGGPILHNRTSNKVAVLLKVGIGISVVTTVAASLGLTGRGDQGDTVMGSTTAIDSQSNCNIGQAATAMSVYRVATPATAGSFFMPLADLHTGALTVDNLGMGWFDIEGIFTVFPGAWISLAASATASTTVMQAGFIWAELDV